MSRMLAIRWLFWFHRAESWQQWHLDRGKFNYFYPEPAPKSQWCDK